VITPSCPRAFVRALPAALPAARLAVPLVVGALALGACGSAGTAPASSSPSAASPVTSPATSPGPAAPASAAGLTLADGWVKAAPSGMTSVFGTLTNATDRPVTVVAVTTPAARVVQLHEVAGTGTAATMRPKAGGFTVPAHGTHSLAPGHDHLMLMDLAGPVLAGSTVTLTLVTGTGASVTVIALAKDYAAGNESYAGSASAPAPGMGSMAGRPSA